MEADTIIISNALIDLMRQNLRMYEIVYFGHCHSIYWFDPPPSKTEDLSKERNGKNVSNEH